MIKISFAVRLYVYLLFLMILSVSCKKPEKLTYQPGSRNIEEVIAILPIDVFNNHRKVSQNESLAQLKAEDEREGRVLQLDMYRYFLRKIGTMGYPKSFLQDVRTTNQLLDESGLDYEDIPKISKERLARILQVDGILSVTVDQFGPRKQVMGILNGDIRSYGVIARFTFHDEGGQLIWKVDRKSRGADDELTYGITKKIMRQIPEKFPFREI